MVNHNSNVTGRRFELQAFADLISTGETNVLKMSTIYLLQENSNLFSRLFSFSWRLQTFSAKWVLTIKLLIEKLTWMLKSIITIYDWRNSRSHLQSQFNIERNFLEKISMENKFLWRQLNESFFRYPRWERSWVYEIFACCTISFIKFNSINCFPRHAWIKELSRLVSL